MMRIVPNWRNDGHVPFLRWYLSGCKLILIFSHHTPAISLTFSPSPDYERKMACIFLRGAWTTTLLEILAFTGTITKCSAMVGHFPSRPPLPRPFNDNVSWSKMCLISLANTICFAQKGD